MRELNQEKLTNLSTVLLSNLDEKVFFSKISDFFLKELGEFKVQAFEVFSDGTSQLKSENGKSIKNGLVYGKGQGLSGYIARVKRAYYSNSKRDPLLATSKRDEAVECELAIPLMSGDRVIGSIHIQSNNEDRNFSEEDVAIVNEALKAFEPAINNINLYLVAKNLNRELQTKIEENEKELKQRGPVVKRGRKSFGKIDLIGHSREFTAIMNAAKQVAGEDFPVLIEGQSGTGKKLLAKKIHTLSNRKSADCLVSHCSSLDSERLEAELFGIADRVGLFEKANGGTLILDSIDKISMDVQNKILRALISGEIYRVNSSTPISVNVRVISTISESIEIITEEEKVSQDLLFRLNIVNLKMPSLAERGCDIKLLAELFLNNGKEEKKILTTKAVEKLNGYNWPGNIQELRNIMERTYILTDGKYVDEAHLPELAKEEIVEEVIVEEFNEMSLHDLEKIHIVKTLDHLAGNKTRAAKSLGITVKTLYNKLHSYGLVAPKSV